MSSNKTKSLKASSTNTSIPLGTATATQILSDTGQAETETPETHVHTDSGNINEFEQVISSDEEFHSADDEDTCKRILKSNRCKRKERRFISGLKKNKQEIPSNGT